MLKKIFLLASLLLMQQTPVKALPGKTLSETESWVKHHPYLAHWVFGSLKPGLQGEVFHKTGFRQLPNNWFIETHVAFQPIFKGIEPQTRRRALRKAPAVFDKLYLLQKKFVGDIKTAEEKSWDPRPWEDIGCKHIWQQNNEKAYLHLSKIYSPKLAEDFRTAQLVYQGPVYAVKIPGWAMGADWTPPPAQTKDVNQYGMDKKTVTDVTLYIGKRYAYEVSGYKMYPTNQPCFGLGIQPREWGVRNDKVLHDNLKAYQQWRKTHPPKAK